MVWQNAFIAPCHSSLPLLLVMNLMAPLKLSDAAFASFSTARQAVAMPLSSSSLAPGVISRILPRLRPCSIAGRMTSARKSGTSPRMPEMSQESASSPVPDHLMSLTGPYPGSFSMTTGGGFSTGGGPYILRAYQSAWVYLLAVSVRPTATPPTPTTLFAQSSRNFSFTDLYAAAKESAPQPVPADWLYWFSTSTRALAPLS